MKSALDFQSKCAEESARLQQTTLEELHKVTAQRDDYAAQLRAADGLKQQSEGNKQSLERELASLRADKAAAMQAASSTTAELHSSNARLR